jgi:hypothetical protein
MHRTDTLDMFASGYGEVYLVTDTDGSVAPARRHEGRKPCVVETGRTSLACSSG